MEAYRYLEENDLESFSLEYISQKELGIGKIKHEMGYKEMYLKDTIFTSRFPICFIKLFKDFNFNACLIFTSSPFFITYIIFIFFTLYQLMIFLQNIIQL